MSETKLVRHEWTATVTLSPEAVNPAAFKAEAKKRLDDTMRRLHADMLRIYGPFRD